MHKTTFMYKSFDLDQLDILTCQELLQNAVAPRPICLASTIDLEGRVNLSPFSFFNMFSYKPPIVIFSVTRRMRDKNTKHTWNNLLEVPELVVNVVNVEMVHQISFASADFEKGVNEFKKAGFTELASELVKPPRVLEAPIQMECQVQQMIPLGDEGGAGNLVLAKVVRMHIQENSFDKNGQLHPLNLNLVARLGGDWYSKPTADSLFKLSRPSQVPGMGMDELPEDLRNSKLLSMEEKLVLASLPEIPNNRRLKKEEELTNNIAQVRFAIRNGKLAEAWELLTC